MLDRVGLLILYLKNTQRRQGLHSRRLFAVVPAGKRHRARYWLSYPPSVREGQWETNRDALNRGPWQVGGGAPVCFVPAQSTKVIKPGDLLLELGSFCSWVDCLPCVAMGTRKSELKLFKKFLCSTQEPIMRLSST